MNVIALAALAVVSGIGLAIFATKASAAIEEGNNMTSLESVCRSVAADYGLDPLLLLAICEVESSRNVNAIRWNPPNDVSVGAMQILCIPPAGHNPSRDGDYVCQNRFPALPDEVWPSTFTSLQDPRTNVDIGARILKANLRDYGFPRGIAVYNDFAARHSSVAGPFPNDEYVDRVLAHYRKLQSNLKGA